MSNPCWGPRHILGLYTLCDLQSICKPDLCVTYFLCRLWNCFGSSMYKHEPLYKLYIKNVHTTTTVVIKSRDDSSKWLWDETYFCHF